MLPGFAGGETWENTAVAKIQREKRQIKAGPGEGGCRDWSQEQKKRGAEFTPKSTGAAARPVPSTRTPHDAPERGVGHGARSKPWDRSRCAPPGSAGAGQSELRRWARVLWRMLHHEEAAEASSPPSQPRLCQMVLLRAARGCRRSCPPPRPSHAAALSQRQSSACLGAGAERRRSLGCKIRLQTGTGACPGGSAGRSAGSCGAFGHRASALGVAKRMRREMSTACIVCSARSAPRMRGALHARHLACSSLCMLFAQPARHIFCARILCALIALHVHHMAGSSRLPTRHISGSVQCMLTTPHAQRSSHCLCPAPGMLLASTSKKLCRC